MISTTTIFWYSGNKHRNSTECKTKENLAQRTSAKIDEIRALIQKNSWDSERFKRELDNLEDGFKILEEKFRSHK